MLSQKNKVILGYAGSGKTTYLAKQSKTFEEKAALFLTYTNENCKRLQEKILKTYGIIPAKFEFYTWYEFLLEHAIRPYRKQMGIMERIVSIYFEKRNKKQKHFTRRKEDYVTKDNLIYSDKTSEFAYECNVKSSGKVIARLERIYEVIFIDEIQDLNGYDLSFIEALFESHIPIFAGGDVRQATYSTNRSTKNSPYKGEGLVQWLENLKNANIVELVLNTHSYRCCTAICEYANTIFPHLPPATSLATDSHDHMGIHFVEPADVLQYYENHKPTVLSYSKVQHAYGLPTTNIGVSKGATYDHVLIIPSKEMAKALQKGVQHVTDKTKLYIGITRARFSAAIVMCVDKFNPDQMQLPFLDI